MYMYEGLCYVQITDFYFKCHDLIFNWFVRSVHGKW